MTYDMKKHTDNCSSLLGMGGVKTLVMMLLMLVAAGVGEVAAQEPAGVQTVEAGKPYRIRTTMIEGMQLSTTKNTVRGGDAIGIFTTNYFAKDQIFYFEATSTNYFIKDAKGNYVNSNDSKTYAGNLVDDNKYKYAIEPVYGTDYVKFKCAGSYYLAPGRGFVNGSPVYGDGNKSRDNTNTHTIVLWKIIPWDPVADLKVLIDAVATYKDNDATLSTAYDAAVATYESYKTTSITDMLDDTGGALTAVAGGISDLTTARDNYLQSIPKPTPGECYIAWSHDTDKLLTRPSGNGSAILTTGNSEYNKMTLESDGTNYYIKNGDYYLAVKGTRAVTSGTNYDTDANVLTTEWKNTKDEACQLNLIPYGNGHFGIQFKKYNNYKSTSSTGGYLDPGPCTDLNTLYPLREDGITNPLGYWTFKMKAPSIIYNLDTNTATISCSTPGATIYYAMGDANVVVSTVGEGYSGSVTTAVLDPGVTTIKAVSKSGDVELSAILTIPFQTTAGSNERPYLIQNDNNKWSDGTIIYYMIPDAPNGNVNTTNVPRPTMEWLFTNATTEAGTTYYSILNKATEKYIYWDGTNIVLKDKSEYGDSDNGFKFNIIEYNSGFNINPYGVSSGNMYVHKSNNNNSANALVLNNARTGNSLWYFVQRSALDLTAPFSAVSESSITYYKLQCVNATTLYITPPTTGSNVVMSTTTDNTVDWYFEEAQTATNEDWNTYYYIRHAATGKYLYYTGTTTINNNQCFELRSSVDTANKSRYMYTWVRYYNGVGQYQIVPHFLLNVSQNNTSVIKRDGNQLKTTSTRNDNNSAWTFEPSTMTVAPPHISYDAVSNKIVISCTTPGATIRYMTGDDSCDDPTSSSGTVYAGGSTGFELPDDVNVIKAIAIKDDNPSSVTTYQVVVHASVGEAKRPYLIQSVECTDFYLLPGDKDNNDIYRITTSSLRRPSMQWYFVAAGALENGYQYYYLINYESGKYAAYYKNASNQDVLCMHDADTFNAAADAEKSKYKFRIGYYDDATAPGYYIRPMDITYEGGLLKGNGNNADNTCWIGGSNDVKTRWNIIPLSKKPAESAPFTVSDATTTAYYKIGNVNASEYFIIPKTLSTTYATTSNEDVDDAKWYFTEAGHDEWVTYYNIVNAVTGEYLYFSGAIQTGTNNNAFVVQSGGTDDRYQFAVARTTESATLGKYYIVPKVLKDLTINSYVLIWRDGTNPLKTQAQRSDDQRKWTFTSTAFKCATPTFFYDDVNQQFHISCTTPGTKIYYKGYDNKDNPPTITLADLTLYTGPFSKEHDYYIAIAARCSDGSDQSDPAYGDINSAQYHYHLIDKSNHEVFSIGSNDETLGLPEAYRSPLVSQYHYYTTNFDTSTNTPTGAEATEVATDIYVTYDVSPLVRLDGTQYYMLRYQNPNNTQLYEEAGDRPKGFPENTQNAVYYPYTNGKEGFNLYGDEKRAAAFDDGENTRTRFLWYFEGGDPYRVKIHSYNGTGTSYHALPGPYPSYFHTFYGNGGSTTTGHTGAAVHTVLTQTDRTNHEPTEYMILNGTGTNTASFPYRLMTTAASGPNGTHLVVSSIDHQWLNAAKNDATYTSRTTNWYQMPELGNDFTQYNKNRQDETTHAVNLWYETIDLGTDFQIEPLQLLPVLHLVDNHGWEIAHWSMENTEACRNRIKQFNSPLVKEYRWYSGESQTGNNRAITKVTGYYKYYINTARPVATTTDLTSNWMHVNFDDASQNLNFYVFYDAKDEYGNGNSYLLDLGGKMADVSGSTINYTANGSDYHVGTELKNGVTPPTAMQWLVAANPDLDAENAYTGTYNYSSDATGTSAGRPEPGKDAGRFDPYSLRIESAATTGNYYTVNGSSYAITLTAGTTAQFTYTDRADLSRQNRGTTFMAVQGTDGKMRLVLRNSDRAESLNRALDSGGTATETTATTTENQTAVLVPTRRNVYTIVRSDGTQVISSTGYTKTLRVPADIASPLLDDTFYSFYPTLQDAVGKTNALTNETFATRYTDPVFVRYDEKTYGNTPIDLSGSTWYNIRNGSQFMTCAEGQPAFTTTTPTDEQLNDDKFFWTFTGDPYTVTVSSKTANDAVFDNTFIWLGNSTYGWNLLANTPAVDNKYAYLYNDGQGHAQQHHETLGQTTAADNLFVEQYDLTTYTYHIINTASTEAVKYTTQQRSVTPLNYDNLPAAIRSPYIEDETLTFYSDAACNTAITSAGEATGGHIYVKYTTGQLTGKRLDLKGTSEYQMRVNGTYVYDNEGSLATGTPTDNWVLTGSDPYAVELKSKTGERSVYYNTTGHSLSLSKTNSGTNNKFILLGGKSGTLVELMAATGADIATETYYSIGLDAGPLGLYASTSKAHLDPALQINFSKVTVDDGTVMEIAFSSDMNANLAGRYKAVQGFSIDETITGFSGTFDGDFQEISSTSLPLFAEINNAVVRNVIIREANISSGNADGDAGAITDVADGASRIYNCGVLGGSVSGSGNVGGLVGTLNGSSRVINCFSYANVKGGTYAAGIVGYNSYASKNNDLKTMVMNCMFYGNVESGTNISPVYGGQIINNSGATGLNNFNYFLADNFTDFITRVTAYNCALGAEKRFLTRFEFYRQILNSNLPLASWYARGTSDNYANEMAKWVLETADRNIAEPKPYPVLHKHGKYPSIINIDAAHAGMAADPEDTDRNKGYRLGTLNVSIGLGTGAPLAARLTTTVKYLNITDKDFKRYNFNYYKVQLPYYNEVGVGNYTDNRVVTGWKITSIEGGTPGTFTAADNSTGYNFADRDCTQKDLYSVTGRVFSQGAYFDVPNGVTGITIEPCWAKAVYLADPCYDKTYTKDFSNNNGNATDITTMGTHYTNGENYLINGSSQMVYTNMGDAITGLGRSNNSSVYDYAVVLVGNYHHYYGDSQIKDDNNGFTIMSADLDGDNEPDNCFIYQHTNRRPVSPIRFDFLCWSGIGMAQKPSNSPRMPDIGIFKPRGWFEVTNTCLAHFYQFEYDWGTKNADKDGSPLILLGGIYEQIVSSNDGAPTHTKYIHLGSNAWFKMFNNGIHADKDFFTPHKPISVTGGDYDLFYLSGMFKPSATVNADNAECYITGGRFGEVAGAGQEQINGDVYWQIDRADITDFYGGGINDAKPVKGNITIDITNSNVTRYCGGPKFGNMSEGKVVTTTAENCTFGKYFGAGYGGTSLNKVRKRNYTNSVNYNFNEWATHANHGYKRQYETTTSLGGNVNGDPNSTVTVNAISTNYEYELFPYSGFANNNNVGRFYVNYASLSLAATNDVNSTLTGCTIEEDFFGGGNLGKVAGNVTSTLTNCTVKGNVYGAGFAAIAPKVPVMPKEGFVTEPHYDGNSGTYSAGIYPATTDYTWHYTSNTISTGNEFDETNHLIYTNVNFPAEGGTVTGNVTLNIGGTTTVSGDVYGGGALASSNTGTDKTTTVNLTGGTINGSVYGGGMGDNETGPTVGNTQVNLNGTKTTTTVEGKEVTSYNDQCVVLGSIFGCNNINGTPLGDATVHIYKTWGTSRTSNENLNDIDDSKHSYHLQAVYGGGNLAAYDPDTPGTKKAYVIIDGCDLTSIKTVYGGGNAASTPATQVDVNGTYEIGEVFGGGNGKDMVNGRENPGANVGYYNYTVYDADNNASNADNAQTPADRKANYQYGTGKANVNIYGGLVHRVYGGSNTKGNVRQVAVTMLDNNTDCDFKVDEAYGGGKSAPMDGAANLVMACIPGLKAAYGGAENANINDNVTLNITNGTFERVFGGNNVAGTISGTITVNIEETGCKPIIIGQLYGGGNQAAYTGPLKAGSGAERQGPTVNVRSFTSIGDVFGGGYGLTAVVTGDTYVNINEVNGKYYAQATPAGSTGNKQYKFTQFKRIQPTTDNPEGYVYNAETGERETEEVTIDVYLPPHAANAMGAINNVYGGGNAAKVIGNTYVNIGTEATINFVTMKDGEPTPATGVAVQGADIRGNVYGGGNQAEVTGDTHVQIGKKVEP